MVMQKRCAAALPTEEMVSPACSLLLGHQTLCDGEKESSPLLFRRRRRQRREH